MQSDGLTVLGQGIREVEERSVSVLGINDIEGIGRLLSDLLGDLGHRMSARSSPSEALELV